MGPGYFVIAILGCADGGSSCTPVTTLQTHYATKSQCTAATAAALLDNSKFDYPTIVAQCRRGETKSADAERDNRPVEKRRHG
jgi:acyl-CoA synthetase (AMP-forming)/AMP-acid ligase II